MKPKISIIVPVYNGEKYIGDTIKSIQAQTFTNWELLIINDGSTDETVSVVDKFMSSDSRIGLYQQENAGVSVARNNGLENAQGEYISFLDADDLWAPTILSKLLESIQFDLNRKFVYARTNEIQGDEKSLIGPKGNTEGYLESFSYSKTNEIRLTFHISAILIERSIIEKYKLRFIEGLTIAEDTAFLLQLLCVTKAYCVSEILSYYVRRPNSATTKKWKPYDWEGQVEIYEYIKDFVEKNRPVALPVLNKAYGYVAYRFIRRCFKNGYNIAGKAYIEKWLPILNDFVNTGGKCMDRIKCRCMMAAKDCMPLLKLIAKI